MVQYNFSGKKALVTGAGKGIGREIALQLAQAGCDIGTTGRDRKDLDSLAEEITSLGRRCETVPADLCSAEETLSLAEQMTGVLEPLDILINNAGTTYPEDLVDLDVEHWNITLNVNLRAPALISKIVAREIMKRKKALL